MLMNLCSAGDRAQFLTSQSDEFQDDKTKRQEDESLNYKSRNRSRADDYVPSLIYRSRWSAKSEMHI